mmetsp:Transcript_8135/g.11750  ORF Transcript_8135/g.11750 Transcript_8135/m.11750 type:complete len:454 (+) Transcript_8135:205-1566(+)
MQAFDQTIPDALLPYKEKLSARFFEVRAAVLDFQKTVIDPARPTIQSQKAELIKTVQYKIQCPDPPIYAELRAQARARGIMNLFLPEVSKLSVLEYAPIAEILGMDDIMNNVLNCNAPDTGNMEVLQKYGTPKQQKQWLEPLLRAEIRSAFAMTEPGVASSDATNIATRIEADGDDYVINGHKWFIGGAVRPECKVFVLMGRSSWSGPIHSQHSMILVPRDAPGVTVLRMMTLFGHEEGDGAGEVIFDNVRVPKENILLGEGRGFEIAQGRLGPGRIHHCMRSIGVGEMALAAMVDRANRRKAFGKILAEKDTVRTAIAEARIELTMCRQLCYLTACMADEVGFKEAKHYVSMLKVAAPRAALKIIDEAIQLHGAHGVSQDCDLPRLYVWQRILRIADGPDQVHLNLIAKKELAAGGGELGAKISGLNKNVEKYGKFSHVEGGALYIKGASKL